MCVVHTAFSLIVEGEPKTGRQFSILHIVAMGSLLGGGLGRNKNVLGEG